MDDKDLGTRNIENGSDSERAVAIGKPPFGTRVKNHFKKWWWVHVIVFIICLLVIVLPLVYVGFPNIAQSQINDARIEIQTFDVLAPTMESVALNLLTVVMSNSSYHPKLDSFNASLFLEDTLPDLKPFGYITVPSIQAGKEVPVAVNQQLELIDIEQFTAFTKVVLGSETFRVAMRGKVNLHEMKFPTTKVDYNQVITTKGLNKLDGFSIPDFNISLKPLADGSNLLGHALIPNPSIMTIEMGDVFSDLSVDGQPIGNTTIPDLTLKPGDNYVPIRGITDAATVLGLISEKYTDAVLPVKVAGRTVVKNGVHLTYYEEALAANPFHVSLNVAPALKALGINLTL